MHAPTSYDAVALKDVAEKASLQAGELLRRMWNEPRQISEKGFRDVVTDADYASQGIITRIIREHFPEHGFLTEESDSSLPRKGDVIWIIDPVDGTTNYSRMVPTFCVSIGAAAKTDTERTGLASYRPIAGAIYDPMRDELFSAADGHQSTLNGREISVSTIPALADAAVCFDWSRSYFDRQTMLSALDRFAHEVRTIRATGSASLSLAWVAAGRLDIYFNLAVGPWDAAAAAIIIKQAGGLVSDLDGSPWSISDPGCVASNSLVHQAFLARAGLATGN